MDWAAPSRVVKLGLACYRHVDLPHYMHGISFSLGVLCGTVYCDQGLLKLSGMDDCNGEPLLLYSRVDGVLLVRSLPSYVSPVVQDMK